MADRIKYLHPLFAFPRDLSHVAVPQNATEKLLGMAGELLGAGGLVAIYIPLTVDMIYGSRSMAGKVVGTVRLDVMPAGRSIQDYFYHDVDGKLRWPCGWPCKVVHRLKPEESPSLKYLIEDIFGSNTFSGYAGQFEHGPIQVQKRVSEELHKRMNID